MPFLSRTAIARTLLLAALAASTMAYAAAPDADSVMAQTRRQAAAAHKNILLSFGASWCGNCRLFDKFLADPAIHPILDKAFVFADLDTGELASDKRHSNIPGGQKIEDSLGGKGVGYPYIVMLDPNGKLIVSSIAPAAFAPAGNIGYPSAPNEVNWFMEMLKKAAPELSAQETATIRNWLTAHGSKH